MLFERYTTCRPKEKIFRCQPAVLVLQGIWTLLEQKPNNAYLEYVNFNRFGRHTLEDEFESELNQARICPRCCAGYTPKLLLLAIQQMVLGGANCVPLKMLKNSVRNSRSSRSLAANLVVLNREESKLSTPYERSRGSTRGSFPNVKSGGAVKQKELNHRGAFRLFGFPSFAVAAPDTYGSRTRFGREPPPQRVVPLSHPLVNPTPNPRWEIVTPATPYPLPTKNSVGRP